MAHPQPDLCAHAYGRHWERPNCSAPLVTADQVELMDIYERQGEKAATKFADQMVRNDRRRERRVERAHYEELARQHNIKLAARKLIEEQQRQAGAASAPANAQEADADAAAVAGQSLRKQPVSAAAVHSSADASPARAQRKCLRLRILPVSTSRIKILGAICWLND